MEGVNRVKKRRGRKRNPISVHVTRIIYNALESTDMGVSSTDLMNSVRVVYPDVAKSYVYFILKDLTYRGKITREQRTEPTPVFVYKQSRTIGKELQEKQYLDTNGPVIPEKANPDTTTPELGAKHDTGKLRFSLLTRGLGQQLKSIAEILTFGAKKYSADSWKYVPNAAERYEDAMDRHLNAWKSGELTDKESGLPHLAHVACNCLFLMWFEDNKRELDTDDSSPYRSINELAIKLQGVNHNGS